MNSQINREVDRGRSSNRRLAVVDEKYLEHLAIEELQADLTFVISTRARLQAIQALGEADRGAARAAVAVGLRAPRLRRVIGKVELGVNLGQLEEIVDQAESTDSLSCEESVYALGILEDAIDEEIRARAG